MHHDVGRTSLWGTEPFDVAVSGDSEKDDLILQGGLHRSRLVVFAGSGLPACWEVPAVNGRPDSPRGQTRVGLRRLRFARARQQSRTMAGNTVNYEDPGKRA
ncbi:MAG: hypothetical protein IPN19_03445 [Elusimicrobia bacterium]|nr:hypothetical protein [Elusimicrobiota bacterium]